MALHPDGVGQGFMPYTGYTTGTPRGTSPALRHEDTLAGHLRRCAMSFRSLLYFVARLLGDVNAAKKGKLPQRLVRKALLRKTGRTVSRLIK
jgi:hypothetical protein